MGLSRHHKLSIRNNEKDDDEETCIVVQINKKWMQTYAFLDYIADGNTNSYELLKQLKNLELKGKKKLFFSPT